MSHRTPLPTPRATGRSSAFGGRPHQPRQGMRRPTRLCQGIWLGGNSNDVMKGLAWSDEKSRRRYEGDETKVGMCHVFVQQGSTPRLRHGLFCIVSPGRGTRAALWKGNASNTTCHHRSRSRASSHQSAVAHSRGGTPWSVMNHCTAKLHGFLPVWGRHCLQSRLVASSSLPYFRAVIVLQRGLRPPPSTTRPSPAESLRDEGSQWVGALWAQDLKASKSPLESILDASLQPGFTMQTHRRSPCLHDRKPRTNRARSSANSSGPLLTMSAK